MRRNDPPITNPNATTQDPIMPKFIRPEGIPEICVACGSHLPERGPCVHPINLRVVYLWTCRTCDTPVHFAPAYEFHRRERQAGELLSPEWTEPSCPNASPPGEPPRDGQCPPVALERSLQVQCFICLKERYPEDDGMGFTVLNLFKDDGETKCADYVADRAIINRQIDDHVRRSHPAARYDGPAINGKIPLTCGFCGEGVLNGEACQHPNYARVVYLYVCLFCQQPRAAADAYTVYRYEKQHGRPVPGDRRPRYCANAAPDGKRPIEGECERVALKRELGAQCFMCGMMLWPEADEPKYLFHRFEKGGPGELHYDYEEDAYSLNLQLGTHIWKTHREAWVELFGWNNYASPKL